MAVFGWVTAGEIPVALDLRRMGWTLAQPGGAGYEHCVALIRAGGLELAELIRVLGLTHQEMRPFLLICGVDDSDDRAELLRSGVGDVISDEITIEELHLRAGRLASLRHWLPRRRWVATMELDLLARDATCAGRPLSLNPREFALLWRLADMPGQVVSKQRLIDDVWRSEYTPQSNSIAVHMSRLRGKLQSIGLPGLLERTDGGYRLQVPAGEPANAEPLDAFWSGLAPSRG